MLHLREVLPLVIFAACLISCCTSCVPNIGQPLNLNHFSGEWYLAAATPMNGSMSKCGRLVVKPSSENAFDARFTTISTIKNVPIAFNVNATVNKKRIIGTWQLEGSTKTLGPFRHIIMFPRYNSVVGMFVCSYRRSQPKGYQVAMILSRERTLPLPLLMNLKTKMEGYINRKRIEIVDQDQC